MPATMSYQAVECNQLPASVTEVGQIRARGVDRGSELLSTLIHKLIKSLARQVRYALLSIFGYKQLQPQRPQIVRDTNTSCHCAIRQSQTRLSERSRTIAGKIRAGGNVVVPVAETAKAMQLFCGHSHEVHPSTLPIIRRDIYTSFWALSSNCTDCGLQRQIYCGMKLDTQIMQKLKDELS